MNEILLTVKVKVKEEYEFEAFSYMKELQKQTKQKDNGCLQYDLHTVQDQDATFYFIEKWENKELLDSHMKKDHFIDFQNLTKDKIESVEMNFLEHYKG